VSHAIAAAGTGGHVYPGLAVGEALVELGIAREDVLFVGGSRLEATAYPEAGFPFLEVELRGLQRRLTTANLQIPGVVRRAVGRIHAAMLERGVRVVLGMGGYVTVPAALAARRARARLMVAEQNAKAGLANRLAARVAARVFVSFPDTEGLQGEWVGNPVRASLARFDRGALHSRALARYGLSPDLPVVGVVGGSLGAGALNDAAVAAFTTWQGPPIQVLHLAGPSHRAEVAARAETANLTWVVLDYELHMEDFYAAIDLVVARAGGAVAELTATGTPAILVPGSFGSGGHQQANATAVAATGAALVISEAELSSLGSRLATLLGDDGALASMRAATATLARPAAAETIARAMVDAHG
jgi:UDP-N-acetylglucosamine--N-acetylmuramyl-(pentapeptide) pyrophosphoryl-undecaprenol N-acetylglucosamine transferase